MLDAMIPFAIRTADHRHAGINMIRFNLARAYNVLSRWTDGEQVLLNQIGHLDSAHPDYIIAMTELTWVYKNLKQFDAADQSYLKPLDTIADSLQHEVSQMQICVAQPLEEVYTEMGHSTKIDALKKRCKFLKDKND